MLRRRRLGGGLLIVMLASSLGWAIRPEAAAQLVAAASPAATVRDAGSAAHTVTLLTGDRVTVAGDGKFGIERGEGRKDITFLTRRLAGHVHVVPADALPLVQAGRLDSRLFDITTLIEFGYDDRRDDLPLVVTAGTTARDAARSTLTAEGATVVREFSAVNGMAVRAAKDDVAGLWQSLTGSVAGSRTFTGGVTNLWLDGLRKPSLDVSVPQVGAPAAWRAGFNGAGVKVAVLDTGIDTTHPDLTERVVEARNFTEGEDDADRVGHGTHVASTIAGTGRASDGKYTGVAPGASLLDGKVCTEQGCAESWILAGMQWAAEQGAAVVNMSLGGQDTPGIDPLEEAVGHLTEQFGMLFVVAAGNDGRDASIGSPASADAAIAVGAVTKADELADFSSRGPRVDGALKPDITAPGVDIVAANSKDPQLGDQGESYAPLSGTSMATPHVAGAAAILTQQRPGLAPAELKSLLMGAAKPTVGLNAFAQGAGRVDVATAISQPVSANPPSVGFGRQLWPHHDDTPVVRTVTYRNLGAGPLALELAAQGTGPDGKPAPAGLFTLSATSLTVPAGGQASITMTADTRAVGADGYYTGRLTATGGGSSVVTPFAIEREVESYDVTVRHLDRGGSATGRYLATLVRTDKRGHIDLYDADGTATVRVPKGPYALVSVVYSGDVGQEQAFLVQPDVSVTHEQLLTADSRLGRPVSLAVPRSDASTVGICVMTEIFGDVDAGFAVFSSSPAGLYTAQLGPERSYPWIRSVVASVLAKVDADSSTLNSPFVYNLFWVINGRVVTGFTKQVKPAQLATVQAAHARQGPYDANRSTFAVHPDTTATFSAGLPLRLPFTRTEYYNTEGGVRWQSNLDDMVPTEDRGSVVSTLAGPAVRYQAGRRYTEQWNRAVFGPSLLNPASPDQYLTRTGNTMLIDIPLYGDGEHHAGYSVYESARLAVYRNGDKIAEETEPYLQIGVPPAEDTYRIEVEAIRSAPADLSTKIRSVWTLRSGHVPGETPVRLPVSVIRFSPELSQHNTAPAGGELMIPVAVQRQPDSGAPLNASLTVQVSHDDGRTWQAAHVATVGGDRHVRVQHPDRPGFVSLRASAMDTAGNTTEQTIIRAYQIAR